jgi:hypothetical protein
MKNEAQRNSRPEKNSAEIEPSGNRGKEDEKMPNDLGKENQTQPRNSVVERQINQSSEESFPASDPPSWSPTTAGGPCIDGEGDCDNEDDEKG